MAKSMFRNMALLAAGMACFLFCLFVCLVGFNAYLGNFDQDPFNKNRS